MNVAMFSTKRYDREIFDTANAEHRHAITYFEARLGPETVTLAESHEALCVFVNDRLTAPMLERLGETGTRLLALRSAGFNHVDVEAAAKAGITVARVPAYSPHAVAEHAVALILALNRKLPRAYARVREGNFSLQGLRGFDLCRRTVGVVGLGQIGACFAQIMRGFGCRVLAFDPAPPAGLERGIELVELDAIWQQADIVSLHCPLTPKTQHLVNAETITRIKPGMMLINTGRGALIDTPAVITGLKSGRLGYLGLDVYEEEEGIFFEDLSDRVIQDDVLMRLLTFPNVLVTAHQGFFTDEALANIAGTTLANVTAFERGEGTVHRVPPP